MTANLIPEIVNGSLQLKPSSTYTNLDNVGMNGGQTIAQGRIVSSTTVKKIVNLCISNSDPDGTVAVVQLSIRNPYSNSEVTGGNFGRYTIHPGNTICIVDETRPVHMAYNSVIRGYVVSGGNAGSSSSDIYTYCAIENVIP